MFSTYNLVYLFSQKGNLLGPSFCIMSVLAETETLGNCRKLVGGKFPRWGHLIYPTLFLGGKISMKGMVKANSNNLIILGAPVTKSDPSSNIWPHPQRKLMNWQKNGVSVKIILDGNTGSSSKP